MDNEGAWNWITPILERMKDGIIIRDDDILQEVYKTLRTRPVRHQLYTDADVQDFRKRV